MTLQPFLVAPAGQSIECSFFSLLVSLFETENAASSYLYMQSKCHTRHSQAHWEQFTLQCLAKELGFKPPFGHWATRFSNRATASQPVCQQQRQKTTTTQNKTSVFAKRLIRSHIFSGTDTICILNFQKQHWNTVVNPG